MTVRNLDKLFAPRSVAVVGATDRPGSVGTVVLRNVLSCGFKGEIYPVNPNRKSVSGLKCYPSAESLPAIPELAIICLPPGAVAGSISDFAKRGTKAAIVLTAGLDRALTADGQKVTKAILEAARPQLMRILGPNCIGLLVPGVGLNAGFAHVPAMSGRIAFVSQSGALCTIVLDWAKAHGIGFSHFVSLGESLDVDMGDVIDYLASDPGTDAILLYVESLKQARKFMSASRAASRNKPVIAIKVGRSALGAKAATTHTGALAGNDAAFSAAFDRAGIVRVDSVEELFETVEVLAKAKRVKGERLAIVTNGGGPGVIAVDELVKRGGQLADLSKATTDALDKVLPPTWSKANPIDIIGDGGPARFAAALRLALAEPNADAVLALYSPTAVAPPGDVAEATIEAARGTDKPVLCGWLGGETVAQARTAIGRAGIAQYETPEAGIRAFCRLVEFHRKQKTLLEVPASSEADVTPPLAEVRRLISDVLESKREIMTAPETRRILSAYRIPTASCLVASNVEEAASAADSLGYPVALKILSPEITHKSDVGGVVLNLADREAVRGAATAMLERVAASRPAARLTGFTVEPMVQRMHAYELLVGVSNDPIFGPVIVFGEGGTAVEVIADHALALPPLNRPLAKELISKTRVAKRLAGYRAEAPVNLESIVDVLARVSQLVSDIPEIAELDINPLVADAGGCLALDARIRLSSTKPAGADHFVISPYPQDLAEEVALEDGRRIVLRPIRPEDFDAHKAFLAELPPNDMRFRFGSMKALPQAQLARLTQIDYDREMAFIATPRDMPGQTLGVVRAIADPDNERAEFAIVVAPRLQRLGLGSALLGKMVRYCRRRQTKSLVGYVSPGNLSMLGLAKKLGFDVVARDVDAVEIRLGLG